MNAGAPNIPLQLLGIRCIAVVITDDDLAASVAAAYDEGLMSAQFGDGMEACPFVVGSPECAAWLRGWDAGRLRGPRSWREIQ